MTDAMRLSICVVVGLISCILALSFGAANTPLSDVFNGLFSQDSDEFVQRIIWQLRMPRTVLAFLAGSGLALAGLILQTVTRNPLADPYLFGISSGASFGVVCFIALTGVSFGFSMSVAAFAGSLLSMLLLIAIAGRRHVGQVEAMLLAGVALSFLFSALTSLLLYFSDPQAITAILFWTMGSFSRAQWDTLWLPFTVIIACMTLMIAFRRQLNAMLLGDESAATLGIHVQRFRIMMLLLSSLITAVLVAMCGGVGFVGLMIPHIVRYFSPQGSSHNLVMTSLVGGIFMVWVDVLCRTLLNNQELPVGVITAAIGSVFFLFLLYFRKQSR
ncbi:MULTISPECIES: FecCD family ABC transporter permease [unclassified Pseudoalteromonas]|uniref:FecCD family ABC transporter permease n=1 Tax=unclassified Pseudoalteromonas TaxID=194690 RepID=UPI0006CA00DC|nr:MULTISPECIES: iron ABC transporter permease [unclassified Pseudoalteromonas]KPM78158.1 ABC transporter permease [Pseudoalteromonas sp. UCD-33C]KPZ74552.1 Hemin transport system permease protein HmuU [Pseudoalteromonas sp. P1-26]